MQFAHEFRHKKLNTIKLPKGIASIGDKYEQLLKMNHEKTESGDREKYLFLEKKYDRLKCHLKMVESGHERKIQAMENKYDKMKSCWKTADRQMISLESRLNAVESECAFIVRSVRVQLQYVLKV